MRISDWSSDVCSSDLQRIQVHRHRFQPHIGARRRDEIGDLLLDRAFERIELADGDAQRLGHAATSTGVASGAAGGARRRSAPSVRSAEHTSELQSLMRISYAVFCSKNKKTQQHYSPQTL